MVKEQNSFLYIVGEKKAELPTVSSALLKEAKCVVEKYGLVAKTISVE